jgi:hypothetical protein
MVAILVTLSAAALMLPVNAQQGSTITLSCNGTDKPALAAADSKPDPITNLGIIVNLANRTVTLNQYVIPITNVTDTLIQFDGQENWGERLVVLSGGIDRVTGGADVGWYYQNVGNNHHWELTCLPATRMF